MVLAAVVAPRLSGAGRLPEPSGWRLTTYDDFSGARLDRSIWWGAYTGEPGGDPAAWWDPSHVATDDGLVLRTSRAMTPRGERWVSGGIGEVDSRAQVYGRYLVHMRTSPGLGISTVALLFPAAGWPPEIDFYEDGTTVSRTSTTATLHHGSANHLEQRTLSGIDLTRWHTFGVDWLPDQLRFTVDGRTWAVITGSAVPHVPMTLDLQTQALTCTGSQPVCPDRATPALVVAQVGWVAIYSPVGLGG
ncbi:MAG TPA: glycoside hydrolase family 16 protein [Acidimicrobiales bacterium]|nr:glycoside hydrolase family 16 protein [Acidimicrobiales bacterium]